MHRCLSRPGRGDVSSNLRGEASVRALAALAACWAVMGAAALLAGCGNPCEEAAQICADEGRSVAPDEDADPAACEGAVEARAECIATAESCAPDVVDGCALSAAEKGTEARAAGVDDVVAASAGNER